DDLESLKSELRVSALVRDRDVRATGEDLRGSAVRTRERVDAEVGLFVGAARGLRVSGGEDRPLHPAGCRELQRGSFAVTDLRVRLVAVLRRLRGVRHDVLHLLQTLDRASR